MSIGKAIPENQIVILTWIILLKCAYCLTDSINRYKTVLGSQNNTLGHNDSMKLLMFRHPFLFVCKTCPC